MSLKEEYEKEIGEDPCVRIYTEEYVTWLEEKIAFLKECLETGAREHQRVTSKLRNLEGGDY